MYRSANQEHAPIQLDVVRFIDIPTKFYPNALERLGLGFDGKDVLDFGCGTGITTLGIASHHVPRSILGVDIGGGFSDIERSPQFHELTDKAEVDIGFRSIRPIENLGVAEFDIIVSWSVLEHVDRRHFLQQMRILFRALRPGGACVFQVAHLYYSAEGHHLFGLVPDWGHLYMMDSEISDLVRKKVGEDRARQLLGTYWTLNRFTRADFETAFAQAGFEIYHAYETERRAGLPARVAQIYNPEHLAAEQSVWTLVRPAGSRV